MGYEAEAVRIAGITERTRAGLGMLEQIQADLSRSEQIQALCPAGSVSTARFLRKTPRRALRELPIGVGGGI